MTSTIKLNKKIYNRGAIDQAMKNYKKLACFHLSERGNYYSICISKLKKGEEKNIIENEFCNHVLALEKVI